MAGQRSRPRVVRRRVVSLVRTPGRDGKRRVEVWSQASQAFAAVAALLLAIPGVILAARTYRDQQVLNKDQQILNGIALERNDRRYASRVTFWDAATYLKKTDKRLQVTLVKVRNMTPLPITDVVLSGVPNDRGGLPSLRPETDRTVPYRPFVQVDVIPPCHETDIWVERGDVYRTWLRLLRRGSGRLGVDDVPNWSSAMMRFIVAGKDWEETKDSLRSTLNRRYDGLWSDADLAAARIADDYKVSKPISDCGENG